MPAKKRVSSAILVGLVEIGVANVPICAYADTTSSTPFNPVSVFMAGFAVGFLIAVGVFVAWLAGQGVDLMITQPVLVMGLMIGTVIGVSFFGGIPVGPLIAAGILYLVIGKF